MKKCKRFLLALSLVLTLSLAALLAPADANAASFTDVSGHWAESYINQWQAAGIVNGYPDGTFRPDGNIKRCETAKMLAVYAALPPVAVGPYGDVAADAWYAGYVNSLALLGFTSGATADRFYPENLITREDAFVMLAKVLGLAPLGSGSETFSDAAMISPAAQPYFNAIIAAGIVNGYAADNTLRPQNPITRGEFCKILTFADNYRANPGNGGKTDEPEPETETPTYTLTLTFDNGQETLKDSMSKMKDSRHLVNGILRLATANSDDIAPMCGPEIRALLLESYLAFDGNDKDWDAFSDKYYDDIDGSMKKLFLDRDSTISELEPGKSYVLSIALDDTEYSLTVKVTED